LSVNAGESDLIALSGQTNSIEWVKKNLFRTWIDGTITVIFALLLWNVGGAFLDWALLSAVFTAETGAECRGLEGACWAVVWENIYLFIHGTYPSEERWRAFAAIALLLAPITPLFFPRLRRAKRWILLSYLSLLAAFVVSTGAAAPFLSKVDIDLFGGLLLTLTLSIVALPLAFPIGILLALGRRSELPALRALSTVYIEVVRGLPMVVILFLASVILPLLVEGELNLDKVYRAILGITLFCAAYQAEVIRGGLQAIPAGQIEAAQALGLPYWQIQRHIVLPQALRIVISPMVGILILFFKDTSLVSIIGLFELTGILAVVTTNSQWIGYSMETYVAVGFVYWVFAFAMSRVGRRLEIRLGNESDRR